MDIRFPRVRAAWWLAWLAAALILAQSQGLVHGIVHGHGLTSQWQAHALHTVVDADGGSANDHADAPDHDHDLADNWLLSLFAGHDGESVCHLFDQLSLGSCMPSFATPVPVLSLARCFVDFFEASQRLPVPTVARARGPPPVR